MKMTERDLNALKKKLPVNYISQLVKHTGLSKSTICNFLSGRKVRSDNGESILEGAVQLIESLETRHQERMERINDDVPACRRENGDHRKSVG